MYTPIPPSFPFLLLSIAHPNPTSSSFPLRGVGHSVACAPSCCPFVVDAKRSVRYIALHHVVMSFRTGPQGEEFDFRRNVDVTAAGMGARVSCSSNDNNDQLDLRLYCSVRVRPFASGMVRITVFPPQSVSLIVSVSAYVPE